MDSSNNDKVYGRGMEELPPIEGRRLIGIVYVVSVHIVFENEVNHTYSIHTSALKTLYMCTFSTVLEVPTYIYM